MAGDQVNDSGPVPLPDPVAGYSGHLYATPETVWVNDPENRRVGWNVAVQRWIRAPTNDDSAPDLDRPCTQVNTWVQCDLKDRADPTGGAGTLLYKVDEFGQPTTNPPRGAFLGSSHWLVAVGQTPNGDGTNHEEIWVQRAGAAPELIRLDPDLLTQDVTRPVQAPATGERSAEGCPTGTCVRTGFFFGAPIYSTPEFEAAVIAAVPSGTVLDSTCASGSWYRLGTGRWVYGSYLDAIRKERTLPACTPEQMADGS